MSKADLGQELLILHDKVDKLQTAFDAAIQGGLQYKHQFEEAYLLLQSIEGINSHPKWQEVQAFLKRFVVIDNPIYGKMVVANPGQWTWK